jgi:hypothetical protein
MEAFYRRPGLWSAISIRDVNGRKLSRRLKRELNPTHRALLAFELERGALWVHHLSRRQAQKLTGANQRHVTSLRRATEEERERVKKGLLPLGELTPRAPVVPTDADIDRVVCQLGAERVMQSLDRLTAPRCKTTAEMFGAPVAS